MDDVRLNLVALGYRDRTRETNCWRVERLGVPLDEDCAPDPAQSPELRRWRKRLARGTRQGPYRITRIAG